MATNKPPQVPPGTVVHTQIGANSSHFHNYWNTTSTTATTQWTIYRNTNAWTTGIPEHSWSDSASPQAVFEVERLSFWINIYHPAVQVEWYQRMWRPGPWIPRNRIVEVENEMVADRLTALIRQHGTAVILHDMWEDLIMEAIL